MPEHLQSDFLEDYVKKVDELNLMQYNERTMRENIITPYKLMIVIANKWFHAVNRLIVDGINLIQVDFEEFLFVSEWNLLAMLKVASNVASDEHVGREGWRLSGLRERRENLHYHYPTSFGLFLTLLTTWLENLVIISLTFSMLRSTTQASSEPPGNKVQTKTKLLCCSTPLFCFLILVVINIKIFTIESSKKNLD